MVQLVFHFYRHCLARVYMLSCIHLHLLGCHPHTHYIPDLDHPRIFLDRPQWSQLQAQECLHICSIVYPFSRIKVNILNIVLQLDRSTEDNESGILS